MNIASPWRPAARLLGREAWRARPAVDRFPQLAGIEIAECPSDVQQLVLANPPITNPYRGFHRWLV